MEGRRSFIHNLPRSNLKKQSPAALVVRIDFGALFWPLRIHEALSFLPRLAAIDLPCLSWNGMGDTG